MVFGIDPLIERIIKQEEIWKENRRRTFSEFIEPVFQDFEKVHTEFIESFEKYRNIIFNSSQPLDLSHQVFLEIERDSCKTEDQRTKILILSQSLEDPIVGNFINTIREYIEETYLSIDARMRFTNAPRSSLFEILSRACSEINDSTFDSYLSKLQQQQFVCLPACTPITVDKYSSQIVENNDLIEVEEFKKIVAYAT
ncbi:MAG: hypothetical protein QNJ70_13050 [Xenococcaceae cyanobacterium MO_207.B15]|nr:hypothetical protein [Xenococcaceae cyanobacterium MO_207.B15]